MPPRNWKSVSIRESVYDKLKKDWEEKSRLVEVSVGGVVMETSISFSDYVTMLVQLGLQTHNGKEQKHPL